MVGGSLFHAHYLFSTACVLQVEHDGIKDQKFRHTPEAHICRKEWSLDTGMGRT